MTGQVSWRTEGLRDVFDNPVMLDKCGHEVLDYSRLWDELSHKDSPHMKAFIREYNQAYSRRHIPSRFSAWVKWFRNLFNGKAKQR